MRGPTRIPEILRELEACWYAHPDWRLAQLVVNVAERGDDPFHCEDDELLENLRRHSRTEKGEDG